jgi:hypothetical protein
LRKEKNRDMNKKIVDYSGKFDPDFSHDKFTSETLLKLLKMYSKFIHRIDATWYLTVMDKWGEDAAFDCDLKVLEKIKVWELDTVTNLLNIHGDDPATVMKVQQASPWMWNFDYEIEVKNDNHAIFTHRTCPTLLSLEKEGKGREMTLCQGIEPKLFNLTAHYFNPNIKVTPLKVPPRKNKNDVACQWEFTLER